MFTPEVFFGLGALVLLSVLIWGMARNRTRNRANDRVTDRATHALYSDPEHYSKNRPALQDDIKPS